MSPESYVASIGQFCGSYVPLGWLPCEGQTLNINQYGILYNLLRSREDIKRTSTTFDLPDFRPKDHDGEPIDWFTAGVPITCICYQGLYPTADNTV